MKFKLINSNKMGEIAANTKVIVKISNIGNCIMGGVGNSVSLIEALPII